MASAAHGANGRNSALIATLKSVCALATWRAASCAVLATRDVSGSMNGKTRATPSTLKAMCASATRRASAVERRLAANAVAQVPILAPSTTGMAPSSGKRPLLHDRQHEPDGRRGGRHARAQHGADEQAHERVACQRHEHLARQLIGGERSQAVVHHLHAEEDEAEAQERLPQILHGAAPARRSRSRSRCRSAGARTAAR